MLTENLKFNQKVSMKRMPFFMHKLKFKLFIY